jgi:glycosyltransferase involved in cell wall biosynthesis
MLPIISVCLICYNQEKYIELALQSILNQKDVSIDVIIADDCSRDNTFNIINQFLAKNNLDWTLLPREYNVGMQKNWQRCINAAKGKYVALLEGDDYWNDSYKLKKQSQILEKDTTLSACFSNAQILNELVETKYTDYVDETKERLSYSDFLENNNVPTCSVLFKNHPIVFPPAYFQSPYADWIVHLLNAREGDYFYLNEKTATYRVHEQGVYGGVSLINKQIKTTKAVSCFQQIFKDDLAQKVLRRKRCHEQQKLAYMYKESGMHWSFYFEKAKAKAICMGFPL